MAQTVGLQQDHACAHLDCIVRLNTKHAESVPNLLLGVWRCACVTHEFDPAGAVGMCLRQGDKLG